MLTEHIIIYQVGKVTPLTRRGAHAASDTYFPMHPCTIELGRFTFLLLAAERTQLRCFFPYAPLRIKKVRLCGPIQIYILLLTPLPIYLVHQYRSRHRRIKRLNSSLHRYLHPYISHLSRLFCQSFRLISN